MGRLASNGSQFSGLSLDPSNPGGTPNANGRFNQKLRQHLCLQYGRTAIIGSDCWKFYSEAIGHVPIWSPTIVLRLKIGITLISPVSLSLSYPACSSPDHLGPLHPFRNEAPLFPWSGPLTSRRSSNGSSYSRHGHCAGQPREETCEVQQSAT